MMLAGRYVFLRTIGLVAITLGAVTLILAMAGVFGVQSHVVALRTREIGVRMSFGASPAQIRTTVLKEGYGLPTRRAASVEPNEALRNL